MNEAAYKKLFAWRVAHDLAMMIYDLTIKFPKDEMYGVTSQIRRAALSVPANIIEGQARNNRNEFRHFLSIALGSLSEVEYFLEFSFERKYLSKEEFNQVKELRDKCGQLLWKLYKSQSKII